MALAYNEGYNIFANLGKGKAILGMYVDTVATGDKIMTPFARCVPVASPGATAAGHLDNVLDVAESAAGEVEFTIFAGTTPPTDFQVIIIGDLY